MAKEKKKITPSRAIIGTAIWVIAIAFIIINVTNPNDNDEDVANDSVSSGEAASEEQAASAEESVDPTDTAEDENEEENVSSNERRKYSEETEQRVIDYYNELIVETDGLILEISQEDNYDQIYVMLTDEFKYLEETDQQIIVDELGNKIENFTRATLFATPASDFLYVYFVDSHGNHLAETGHFDKGWSVN
ncbi:hypothetical protein J18TS1_44830 [Oceanobacillus oncorhynchi subsp. incaldanensis]|uniref:Uncharacterized protein n=2 Tax=Oceanobacillus TaxID=182709 RepID=A0A0A1MJB5_9BACI|nr:hypothetical protein [Oceanobacillus oncorhynchi]MDM8102858.1 hypothetical protein [Oceanobacillus oncorhynchi]GIO21383.1 hypothetical protein J18TS1_44830 [Oceanobacillus oncorhynchi subsp. incaldanensis]CEI83183.1 hypothetical protein BN997_03087 [Oceanobacillus oncorhynchi]